MSSAKMRVLRPQVEELNAKYPGQDKAVERQRAIMELYSRAGASPMAGCVPMLLQMPILVALFMFFPSAIELRHQSFLWAHDLSTYDAIVKLEYIYSYYYTVLRKSYQFVLFVDDRNEHHIYEVQYGSDEHWTAADAGNEGDDVHDAADDVGILQSVCIRFDLLLLHLHIDPDFADCNFPLYD